MRFVLACCRLLTCLVLLLPAATAAQASASEYALDLAVLQAPDGTRLEDILSGQARVGFTPVLRRGVAVQAEPGKSNWLRLRLDFPADGQPRFLRIDRQAFTLLRLYEVAPEVRLLAEIGKAPADAQARWPDAYVFEVTGTTPGAGSLYLEVQGAGYYNLQPHWLTADELSARDGHGAFYYRLLYLGLSAIIVLALFRHWRGAPRIFGVAIAGFFCLLAALIGNGHFQLRIAGAPLGPGLPYGAWLVAMGSLLWATRQYAGQDRTAPQLGDVLDWVGAGCLVLGVAVVFVPAAYIAPLQWITLLLMVALAALCLLALAMDPRRWRWGPILIWLGVLPALLAQPLAMTQWLPASFFNRRGFELLFALLLASYLLLPWLREWRRRRDERKRNEAPELSVGEKIEHARAQLMGSLESGLQHAFEDDMEWIAYRRLLQELKPILPQTASAVVAMNYHNEDLLLVEPKSAQERYQALLQQRTTLLKNLSKLRAPQQVSIDFDGPEGPLPAVQLAVIPLPVDKPGWGALLIERAVDVTYSEEELDLCAEFASLAMTAAEEAAEAMESRKHVEIDLETGVYRQSKIESLLEDAVKAAGYQGKSLCLLRIGVDGGERVSREEAAPRLRALAQLLREEADYGDILGRCGEHEFLLLAPGHTLEAAHDLAARLCNAVRGQLQRGLPGGPLTISIGLAPMAPHDRNGASILQRATVALSKARQYGGNQVQAVASL
jgi:diguanylate cyclase (GGDEF)-like protein